MSNDIASVQKSLNNLSDEELREIAYKLEALSDGPKQTDKRPETDDELHQWFIEAVGINIPRKPAVPGHQAPFEWVSDLFFGRVSSALVLGSRGSGKSFIAALLLFALCYWYQDIECMTVGAIEIQAKRVYTHVKNFQNKAEQKLGNNKVKSSQMSVTLYETGASYEVVTSSMSAVNGPHCSPPDEPILTTNGYKRIDEIDPRTDQLASYSATNNKLTWGRISGGGRYGKSIDFEFEVTSRLYQGNLITMDTVEAKARITPNHKIRIKLAKSLYDKEIVYLMRKGNWWKIGITRGDRITRRVAEENADDVWVLEVFDNLVDAVEMELILQAKYGITGCCFNTSDHNFRINNPANIHNALSSEATLKAYKLLIDYNMFADMPLFSRTQGTADRNFIYNCRFDTAAGNILPIKNHVLVPEATKEFENKDGGIHHPVFVAPKISTEYYEGDVYSLDILPHHYYISGGIVVHNSQVVHRDEIELMDQNVYRESLNIEKSKKLESGEVLGTRTLLTSTRKRSDGLMQKLLDECELAVTEGRKPPFKVYNMNIYDVMENQPNCRAAFPDLPEEEKCNCNEVVSGEWEEGVPRTFEDACGGVLANAEGFTPIQDAHNIFAKSPQALWEAQQENKRPYVEDVSYPQFSKQRHGIINFEFDPGNGPVYCGVDVGGTNPHAVEWGQLLEFEVEVKGFNGVTKRLPEGSLVIFREVYIAEIGIVDLAKRIVSIEKELKAEWPEFRVEGRYLDPQAKSAKMDLKKNNPPLDFSKWPTMTRDREVHFTRLRERVNDDLLYIDVDRAPMICEELEIYNFKNKDFDHAHDATAYLNSNLHALLQKGQQGTGVPNIEKRGSIKTPSQFSDRIPSVVKISRDNAAPAGIDSWRESLIVKSKPYG